MITVFHLNSIALIDGTWPITFPRWGGFRIASNAFWRFFNPADPHAFYQISTSPIYLNTCILWNIYLSDMLQFWNLLILLIIMILLKYILILLFWLPHHIIFIFDYIFIWFDLCCVWNVWVCWLLILLLTISIDSWLDMVIVILRVAVEIL